MALTIEFRTGFLGLRKSQGRISIATPGEVIKFTQRQIRPDMTISHPLAGDFFGFPKGKVSKMAAVAHTDKDYTWFDVAVNGREQGDFSGTMYLWHANENTPVRFDGFDQNGKPLFRTDYLNVKTQLISDKAPKVASASGFLATISRIARASHPSGDIPVAVYYDVKEAPAGTESLSLAFVTNQEWPQGRAAYQGPGEYVFTGHIWSGHSDIIGRPAGAGEKIPTIIRAQRGGEILAELASGFTLDEVSRTPVR